MVVFVTSSIGDIKKTEAGYQPAKLYKENHFLDNVSKRWKSGAHVTVIASDPDDTQRNDGILQGIKESLEMSKLSVFSMTLIDHRNHKNIQKYIDTSDVLILSGGHVPTQHAFFEEMNLEAHLKSYKGMMIGISAGSMNLCETVYAHPELPGETKDVNYVLYHKGLGYCKIAILPHYTRMKAQSIDDTTVYDLCIKDSYTLPFIALDDGSYIMIENNVTRLYGSAYIFKKGECTNICKNHKSIIL